MLEQNTRPSCDIPVHTPSADDNDRRCAEIIGFDSLSESDTSQCRSAEPTYTQIQLGSYSDLTTLSIAEKRLKRSRRENHLLRMHNEQLRQKLTAALDREAEARRMAYHDMLTGLPNRLSLLERLQQGIAAAVRQQHQLALLFIDLDGFKTVNDRFGHLVGDALLKAVASRITTCVRSDDIASRFGGDEFVVLLSNVSDPDIANHIATKIREHIGQDYMIDGEMIKVTASVGVALYPGDGKHCNVLLSCADTSMYRSKFARISSAHGG